MGMFDDLAGKAMGMLGDSGEDSGGMLSGIINTLAPGGLGGLVQSFKDKGLGETAASWIGKGENLPISADQIQSVLGNETIQNLASKFGISSDQLSSMLAQYLPETVDKLTPEGTIPDNS